MDPVVHLRAAVALTGRFPLLAGVDLEVAPGTLTVLEGANGAGKTSLLRLCAGLLALAGGEGTVLGLDLRREASALRRSVGLLGHAPALYDDLTASENVHFALRASGGDRRRAQPAMERFGVTGRLAREPAGGLSAGQRRRVALAVLAARRPPLWLLDEPHAALDSDARNALDALVAEALDDGATVMVASHAPGELGALASSVVTIGGGRVLADRRVEGAGELAARARQGAHVA